MTKEDWVRNNRGIDNGKDIPRKYLEEVSNRENVIKKDLKIGRGDEKGGEHARE